MSQLSFFFGLYDKWNSWVGVKKFITFKSWAKGVSVLRRKISDVKAETQKIEVQTDMNEGVEKSR